MKNILRPESYEHQLIGNPDLYNNDPVMGYAPNEVFGDRGVVVPDKKGNNANLIKLEVGKAVMITQVMTDEEGATSSSTTSVSLWDGVSENIGGSIVYPVDLLFGYLYDMGLQDVTGITVDGQAVKSKEEFVTACMQLLAKNGLNVNNLISSVDGILVDIQNPDLLVDPTKKYLFPGSIDVDDESESNFVFYTRDEFMEKLGVSELYYTFSNPNAYVTVVFSDGYRRVIPTLKGEMLYTTLIYDYYAKQEIWEEHSESESVQYLYYDANGEQPVEFSFVEEGVVEPFVEGDMILYKIEPQGPAMITFTIDNVENQAESGMTWGAWVDSIYNTDGWYVNTSAGDAICKYYSGGEDTYISDAYKDDKITPNGEYSTWIN